MAVNPWGEIKGESFRVDFKLKELATLWKKLMIFRMNEIQSQKLLNKL